jgi:hypothetical protein
MLIFKNNFFLKYSFTFFLFFITNINYGANDKNHHKKLESFVTNVRLFGVNSFCLKALPKLFQEIISEYEESPYDKLLQQYKAIYPHQGDPSYYSEFENLAVKWLASEVHRYVAFNEFISNKDIIEGKWINSTLKKEINPNLKIFLLATLFEKESLDSLRTISLYKESMESAFEKKAYKFYFKADPCSDSDSIDYASTEFYYRKINVGYFAEELLNFWLKPSGNSIADFNCYYQKRKDLDYFATRLYVMMARANDLRTGNIDLAKIKSLNQKVNSMNELNKALSLIMLTGMDYPILERFLEKGSVKEDLQSWQLILSKKELIATNRKVYKAFVAINKKVWEKFLISDESIVDDPDYTPKLGNRFYQTVVKYIIEHQEGIWTKKEFDLLVQKSNNIVKSMLKKTLPDKVGNEL